MDVCVGGFLSKKNKFLFGKRSAKKLWAAKHWDIVGGHSKPGESLIDALKRETREEIGIKILSARLLTSLTVNDKKSGDFEYHIYMITAWTGKPRNKSKEHTKIKWFTRKKLSKVKLALKEYLLIIDKWQNGSALPSN